MKKVYTFNLILNKVILEGIIQYDHAIVERNALIKEKDKEIKTHKNTVSHLNNQIEYIKKCAENEIDHRNKLIDEQDKEIEYLRSKLREETLKSEAYIDRINTLETTLKKKDETIKKLRDTAEFANHICDGYGALTDTLTTSIEVKNSEIKVLSDQVTRLMDQLNEVMEGNSGCKSCLNGPEPCCDICGNTDCEHRTEKEAKPETNFDKIMVDMHSKLTPARLAGIIKTSECEGVSWWLEENTKED